MIMKKFENKKVSKLKKLTRAFSVEQKAQSGAVFRLMVDGIVGFAILLIVISTMAYFQGLRIQASNEKFFSLVKSATDTPTGKVIVEKNLLFTPSGFSTISIRDKTNVFEGCFRFQSNQGAAVISDDGDKIDFTTTVETDVYARCTLTGDGCNFNDEDCCEFDCVISFGKKLVDE